jgi:DNA-binding transcriptional LysR family regulator
VKLHQLHAVLTVAAKGSVRAAARHLGVSQPALTHRIRGVERELQAPLFERRARGVVLTPAGQVFLKRAGFIEQELRRAQEEVAQLQGGVQGTVDICASFVAHIALLPRALPLFWKRYPNVRLRILEGAFPRVESQLREGTVDLYVGPPPKTALSAEFAMRKLFDNVAKIFARKGHPLSRARRLSDLIDAAWLTTGITEVAEAELAQFFAEHKLPPPRIAAHSHSLLTTVTALTSSDVMVLTARQLIEWSCARDLLQAIDVGLEIPALPIVTIRRTALPLTPAAEYLSDMLERAAAQYAGKKERR